MNAFKDKTVIVGVSGGIAAYKTCGLVSKLVQSGANVHVAMTRNATEFVAPLSFEALSRNRVVMDTFDRDFTWEVEHVSFAKKADAVVIAPATANIIAKLAHGIADDFLTTTVLACRCPIMFAPAMNTAMFENAVVRENIDTLVKRGFIPVYGGCGYLACGDVGGGRMAEPEELIARLAKLFDAKTDLANKTVLVTAGATRLDIDPVRYVSNRSSGKMGYALACAAQARGANVVFVKGFTDDFVLPDEWTVESVRTTREMLDAVQKHAEKTDAFIMAAAPCDYETKVSPQKIKSKTLELEFTKAPDVAQWTGEHKGESKLVIFAAEAQNCEANARKKLTAKHADMVVLNDVTERGAGFDTDTNIATLITAKDEQRVPIMQKRELADVILDKLLQL